MPGAAGQRDSGEGRSGTAHERLPRGTRCCRHVCNTLGTCGLVSHDLIQVISLLSTAAAQTIGLFGIGTLWLCTTSVGPGETLPWESFIETDVFNVKKFHLLLSKNF